REAAGAGHLSRQSSQGCHRAGGAEHEREARLERSGGPEVKYVVKLGGASIEDKALLQASGKAITELVRDGNQVALVHGGGKQLTATLAQMGKTSEFISGL